MGKKILAYKDQLMQGFSLLELIVILVIIGILSAVGTSRFSVSTFGTSQFNNQVYSGLRYMQRMAISSRCYTQVNYNTSTKTFTFQARSGFCSGDFGNVASPGGDTPFTIVAPNETSIVVTNATLTGSVYTFYFDGLGRTFSDNGSGVPNALVGANVTIVISDPTMSRTITILPNFGNISNANTV